MNKALITTLDAFVEDLQSIFGANLYSIYLYGSITYNDFHIGKGDIDFVVILNHSITELKINEIIIYHESLRNGKYAVFGQMLEGSYYPIQMFENNNIRNTGFYVGTKRGGWQAIHAVKLNQFDIKNLHDYGMLLYGKDIRHLLSVPTMDDLKKAFQIEMKHRMKLLEKETSLEFIIDTVYFTLRGLSLYDKGQLVSKSLAVQNYIDEETDETHVKLIYFFANYRLPLSEKEKQMIPYDIAQEALIWIKDIYERNFK